MGEGWGNQKFIGFPFASHFLQDKPGASIPANFGFGGDFGQHTNPGCQ